MASASDAGASPEKATARFPSSSSPGRAENVVTNAVVEGERTKAIASLASLDATFSEVSTSQTSALESLNALMRELAGCEEAASIPETLAPALDAAAALRARVRRASRKLHRASKRAARVEAAVAKIRERRRRQQGGETHDDNNEGESDTSSLSST